MAATKDNRVAELERANAQLRRQLDACSAELKEARDQQTATTEVLGVINSSPGDLAPVFDTTLEKALRLCDAAFGILFIRDGEFFRAAATLGLPAPLEDFLGNPFKPDQVPLIAGAIQQGQVLHIHDLADSDGYRQRLPSRVAGVELGGARTVLYVPLTKDGRVLGVFVIFRQEVRPFSDKQITLLQNFAAQAVIAMENARLLTETREALEQQTATAEVLQVINSSPGDLAPVFDAILEKAHTLCSADYGALLTYDGERFWPIANRGASARLSEATRDGILPWTGGGMDKVIRGAPFAHIHDMAELAKEAPDEAAPAARALVELGGIRTQLIVPLRKDNTLLGVITANRQQVRPFSDKQIALLQNFAAQAVIAMENARLITETRKALEQQTATAEVLQVINSSPGELTPVFDAMLEKALRLCEASFGVLSRIDGENFSGIAVRGASPALAEALRQPRQIMPGNAHYRLVHGEDFVQVEDITAEEIYRSGNPTRRVLADVGGARTALWVALRKEDAALGAFVVYRQEVRPFTDKQIALLQNFAAQAVIAMENARLLTETREALEQQTATAEVLQVINSSPGDLAPVFDAMLEKAMRLCEAAFGMFWTYDGVRFEAAALRGVPAAFAEFLREPLRAFHRETGLGRMLRGERVTIHVDMAAEEAYRAGDPLRRAIVDLGGARSAATVALRKDDTLLGAFTVFRQEVRPFTDKQIALLQNFAAQAVIAMENARLINETREALEQQTATAEVLQVINASPGDFTPVFEAILDKARAVCGFAHGSLNVYDGEYFRTVAMHGYPEAFAEVLRQPRRTGPQARFLEGERIVHITDVAAETPASDDPVYRAAIEAGVRTVLFVPLRNDRNLLGYLTANRREARPFSEKEIVLLENFAAQAVIAMENARLLTETREALEQQTATAEVLQVINSSPGDLDPVFDAILEKAHSLCGAASGGLVEIEGEQYRAVAVHGEPRFAEYWMQQGWIHATTGALAQLRQGEPLHIPDITADDGRRYSEQYKQLIELSNARSVLMVPMRKDNTLLGAITALRQEVRPFSDKQIALLQNFAAQAVIAMENARLLTETREALEQQTATAEVLQVINSSPGDLAPVFDAMLEKATRLCEAPFGILRTWDGERLHFGAVHGDPQFSDWVRQRGPVRPDSDRSPMGRILSGERVVSVADVPGDEGYRTSAGWREMVEASGVRSAIWVALHKDDALLGYITVYRQEVRPFTDKQIALLQNFAAQAVIAMENARLITETREALEQQTATAEVLQVINSSPGDLKPVFDAMLEKAMHLCGAAFGTLWTYDEDRFRPMAYRGVPARYAEFLEHNAPLASAGTGRARILAGERVIHVSDLADEEPYRAGDLHRRALVDLGGARTGLIVPLLKHAEVLGYIRIYRQEVRPFSVKQIALLQNFAAQAVIAMENARLLTEQREALERQAATAEVLGIIASSPARLEPVFEAMLANAVRICAGTFGTLALYDGEGYRGVAAHGAPFSFPDTLSRFRRPVPGTTLDGLEKTLRTVQLADCAAEPAYDPVRAANPEYARVRSHLCTPMIKDNQLLGAILIYRDRVQPFDDKQIELVENFAKQAVIAIENARLITETREALEQQTATAEVLQVINSSPGDLTPVFEAILDKARAVCGFAHGSLNVYDGEYFRTVAMHGYPEAFAEALRQPRRTGPQARFLEGERIVHITDVAAETPASDDPVYRAAIEAGVRTVLFVPLRNDRNLLGYLTANRREARPFSEKEIVLLENFAAQAVIAMENARLITETREALEQQTATAEVLQVINSSPADLAPVFDAMLEKALNLCGAAFGILQTIDGKSFQTVAHRGVSPAFADFLAAPREVSATGLIAEFLEGARFVHRDAAAGEGYRSAVPVARALVELEGARTLLAVPLRKDATLVGTIVIYRREVRPFSDKQIALLQNFAAQAVIAMENARLLGETREALEQQTATAEVLQVINSSPGDLAPVFDAMLEKAVRLCDFAFAALWTYDGTAFHPVALHGMPAAFEAYLREHTPPAFKLLHDSAGPIHFPDVMATEMPQRDPEFARVTQQLATVRTLLLVPLRKDAGLLGAFVAYRQEVRPFSDKQISLLQNFAAQAVIAMENARLLTETREALDQQTATAEVLQVINSSPGELAPVFDAILEKAHSFCGAVHGSLHIADADGFRGVAMRGVPEAFADFIKHPFQPGPNHPVRELIGGAPFATVINSPESDDPIIQSAYKLAGMRTGLFVPLRKDRVLRGYIVAARPEVRPFTDKQIALLQNFAAQAVIAMENARLLTETREALEQQTATAEVLQVINSSPGDLAPVFDAMLEKAMRLCRIALGALELHENGKFRAVAVRGVSGPLAELLRRPFEPPPESPLARLIAGEKVVQITDMSELARLRPDDPRAQAGAQYGLHTALFVPLRKDAELLGQIVAFRQEVRPFSEKEIALLQNFAAQAVIAMENARLITELRERTSDLEESLEYQTATSDVLRVISGSVFDLEPVLQTVLSRATDLCRSPVAEIFRVHDGGYRWAAGLGVEPEYEEIERRSVIQPGPDTLVGRVASERRMVHVADVLEDPLYGPKQEARLGKFRTMLGVPLLRDDMVIGVIAIARWIVEPYTDKEIRLVTTFADQAVIAIENARLLGELRERTAELGRSVEELKMLGEVGRAVSSTLDLRAVLSTILTASLGMTWATAGAIFRYIRAERAFRLVEAVGWDEALLGSVSDLSIAETETLMSEAALQRTPIQLTDLAELPSTRLRDASLAAGLRSVLIVPLVGPERIFGALVLQRREAGEFPAETVRLMQTLASQSVLAIQNARLFREIADKSEQLALASEHKSQFLANMSHELRTPLNAILGYAELLVDGIYGVLPEKAQGVLERVQNNGKHLLALINDVLDLAKIEAGQLALTLEDYSLAEVVRGVVTATEPLAAAKGLKFTANVQDGMPMAHGDARRVSQVLLNLAGNAIKFTDAGEVEINASAANGQFLLTVRDTGPGIADADQERIFGEFQQIENTDTRKKGGTGLGLAISKRMVEMQGGMISVDSTLGRGSTFRVVLPVQVEPAMEEAAE